MNASALWDDRLAVIDQALVDYAALPAATPDEERVRRARRDRGRDRPAAAGGLAAPPATPALQLAAVAGAARRTSRPRRRAAQRRSRRPRAGLVALRVELLGHLPVSDVDPDTVRRRLDASRR